jgi:hypothetical protein
VDSEQLDINQGYNEQVDMVQEPQYHDLLALLFAISILLMLLDLTQQM